MGRLLHLHAAVALAAAAFALAPPTASAQTKKTLIEWDGARKKSVQLYQASKYDEANAELARCLELLPNEPGAAYDLACIASIRSQLDASLEWLGKSIDWNYGLLSDEDVKHLEKNDNDLINVRKDARFAALVDRMKARRKAVADALAKPAIYVPAKLKDAASVPLLVVLHDQGETCAAALEKGPWKRIADELGFAVVAPSGSCLVGAEAAAGMRWFDRWFDYAKSPYVFEKGITTALDVFKKGQQVDATRLYIAGMGQGGLVAFNYAASTRGTYQGAVVWNASVLTVAATAATAKMAAKSGFQAKLLEPAGAIYCPQLDPKDVDAELAALPKTFADWGLKATVEKLDKKADEPDLAFTKITEALKSLLPAPEPPAEPEKKDEEKEGGDEGGGGN